jgi:hypothetical protein
MRAGSLLLVLLCACNGEPNEAPANAPSSVRERLVEANTRLMISTADSAGTITAQRRVAGSTWEAGLVDLQVDQGEVVASAAADTGNVTIENLSFTLKPIEIPETVFNRKAQLSNVRGVLKAPVAVTTTWSDDDTAHLSASLDLAFSWSLTVDSNTIDLGEPNLPPVTIEIDVTGDGSFVHADVKAGAAGELWSWAGLIKLEDLHLVLGAETL